jgi:hypothetical protein
MAEVTYLNDHICLVSIDPGTITSPQLRLLEKECSDLQPVHQSKLDDSLFTILKLIYIRNLTNLSTSYRDITTNLKISKPTARKRCATLVYMGYLSEGTMGRKKTFSITGKGHTLFSE